MEDQILTIRTEERLKLLQRENDLLNSIIQGASDCIYAKDLEGRYISMNEAGAAFLNRTVNEVIGRTDEALFGTEESVSYMEQDAELFRTGKPVVHVNANTLKGETRYFRTSRSPLLNAEGELIGLIGVSRDITTAHLAQKKYKFIFENAPIAFWEEDFSEVKKILDRLKKEGVRNFRRYFEKNPQVVEDCIDSIRILNVNGTTLKMYDTDDKEMFVKKLRRDFTAESEKIFNDEFVALANGKTSFRSEGALINGKGEELNVIFNLNVLPGHEDDLAQVLVSVIDVTDTRQLTSELNIVKHRYQSIVDEQSEMICRINPNGKVIFRNPAFIRFFEFKDTDNSRFVSLFPPSEVEKCEYHFQQFSVAQPSQTCELQNYDKNGNIVWQQWSVNVFYGNSGTLLGYQAVGSDITDRKNAELALATSEARWRAVFEQADDLIMTVNSEGFILSVNDFKSLPKKLKWAGNRIEEVMLPENAKRVMTLLKRVFDKGEAIKTEVKIRNKEGGISYFSCSATPIFHGTRVLSVTIIARDISETKEIEKHTKQALIEGQENERTRVSRELHDGLGQLFTAIKLNLQELRSESERTGTCPLTGRLSILEENIGTAISEVKNISRNLMPDVLEQFGLLPAMEDLILGWKDATPIEMSLEMTGMEGRFGPEIEKGIFRMSQELLNNAVRHSSASHIFVQVINHGNSLLLIVEDDGQGYNVETISRGFGLRNIYSRAELLEGTVEVDTGKDRGTVTSVEIPLNAQKTNP